MRTLFILLLTCLFAPLMSQADVTATINASARTATMSNGIVTFSINSGGQISSLVFNGKELISGGAKFYLDYTDTASNKAFSPNAIRIEKQTADYAEIVYTNNTAPIVLEQGFILRKNVSGIYTYVTVKGTSSALKVREMRIVYRVSPTLFTYGYVSDRMQGQLPSVADMITANDTPIMDATYQLPDGTIYTKYDWTNYILQDSVHGIMSANEGVWAIPVTHEYVNGGPMKQELTVHTTNKTPLVLQMLQGEHMGASAQTFKTGDEKIYGPFFIYLNKGTSYSQMIDDAKQQVPVQKAQWPFDWFTHSLFPLVRTTVTGTLHLEPALPSKGFRVVLAQPGSDIYDQGKQYIYWGITDSLGNFSIANVRPGTYTLYAYATEGDITDELSVNNIVVSGTNTNLNTINWIPTKYQYKLWQIGENDRLTSGFRYSDTIRKYGLYSLPPADLNYVIGTSTPNKDWYYAQTKAGSWTVTFTNDKVLTGNATLTVSVAGAAYTNNVDVYVNGVKKTSWGFTNDASVYRSAVLGGKHSLKTLVFPASLLAVGSNTIAFKMTSVGTRGGLMYDCIKLEAGNALTKTQTIAFDSIPPKTYGDAPFDIHTTVSPSGYQADLAVVSGPAILSGNTITLTGAGLVTLQATQKGNAIYNAASQNLTFNVAKASLEMAIDTIPSKTYGDAPFAVSATVRPEGYQANITIVTGPATINEDTITLTGAGTVTIMAHQPGDDHYSEATQYLSFNVDKAPVAISWATPQSIVYGTPLSSIQLNATTVGTTSILSYSPPEGTLLPVGANTLTVSCIADDNYKSADTSVVLEVTEATPTFAQTLSGNEVNIYPNPVTKGVVTITLPELANGSSLTIKSITGTTLLTIPITKTTTQVNIDHLPNGYYFFCIQTAKGIVVRRVGKV